MKHHYLSRSGISERYSSSAIDVELRSEDPIGHAWFCRRTGVQITEWSNAPDAAGDYELTTEGDRMLAVLEEGEVACG